MYGTTLFHVHNSKIFAAGHFFIAANSSGVQFLHPITKEELHSAFFFSDLQRWEYTPKVFCFWSTKCDFLEDTAQGRHLVKYSLSTKQGWEISTTLHSYYKVLMQTDVSVHTAEAAPSSPMLPKGKRGHIAYEAESDSGDEGEGIEASKLGGSAAVTLAVTTFTPQPLTPQLAIPQLGGVEGSVPTTHQSALALPLQRSPPAETATAATYVANVVAFGDVAATDEEASTGTGGAGGALFASSIGAASLATMLAAMASGEGIRIEGMRNEFERVKREIEAMEKMKRECASHTPGFHPDLDVHPLLNLTYVRADMRRFDSLTKGCRWRMKRCAASWATCTSRWTRTARSVSSTMCSTPRSWNRWRHRPRARVSSCRAYMTQWCA